MSEEVTLDIDEKAEPERVPEAAIPVQSTSGSGISDKAAAKPRSRTKILLAAAAVLLIAAAAATGYYFFAGWESTDDAQIDGYITNVYVDDNQYVKAGTLLAQIDPTDYEVALGSAQATLANDRATADASQVNIPITSVNTTSTM